MKLCSGLTVFVRNFFEKRQIWVSKTHFGEVRGDARPWFVVCWKAHGLLPIHANWTFFRYHYGYEDKRQHVYRSVVFTRGSTSLHSNFTWTGSSSIGGRFCPRKIWVQRGRPSCELHQSYLASENDRDTELPDGKDRIPLRSLVLTQYGSVMDGDRHRHTDGYAVTYTAIAKLCGVL